MRGNVLGDISGFEASGGIRPCIVPSMSAPAGYLIHKYAQSTQLYSTPAQTAIFVICVLDLTRRRKGARDAKGISSAATSFMLLLFNRPSKKAHFVAVRSIPHTATSATSATMSYMSSSTSRIASKLSRDCGLIRLESGSTKRMFSLTKYRFEISSTSLTLISSRATNSLKIPIKRS